MYVISVGSNVIRQRLSENTNAFIQVRSPFYVIGAGKLLIRHVVSKHINGLIKAEMRIINVGKTLTAQKHLKEHKGIHTGKM